MITILAVLLSGCVVLQKNKIANENLPCDIRNIIKNNYSDSDFNIIRADIKIIDQEQEQKLIANIRFKYPDIYLVSLRSRSGIEAARALITKDTIILNDRFNKKLYIGSGKYLSEKYGLRFSEIPVIFGDLKIDSLKDQNRLIWDKGQGHYEKYIENGKVEYLLSCRENKILKADIRSGKELINAAYSKFKKYDLKKVPGKIRIEIKNRDITIEINLVKVNFEAIGKINFVPGKDYNIVILK